MKDYKNSLKHAANMHFNRTTEGREHEFMVFEKGGPSKDAMREVRFMISLFKTLIIL